MSLIGSVLKFARAVVDFVVSSLNQQIRIVTDQAFNPMRVMQQQVQAGGIWRGNGADAFVQDVTSMMMPNTQRMSDVIGLLNRNVQFATQRIEQADAKAASSFQQLSGVFSKIYNL